MVILGATCLLDGGITGGGYSVYGPGEGVGHNHYMRGDGNKQAMNNLRQG